MFIMLLFQPGLSYILHEEEGTNGPGRARQTDQEVWSPCLVENGLTVCLNTWGLCSVLGDGLGMNDLWSG